MTTQVFSDKKLTDEQIEKAANMNKKRELAWLIKEIVRPRLPQIKEGLNSCLRQVSEDNESIFKLPLTSHKSEMLKGTISRQNYKIVGLNISIRAKSFNGGTPYDLKLKTTKKPILIRQLLDCHDRIYNAVSAIDKALEAPEVAPLVFLSYIERLSQHICAARLALDKPNPAYIFPEYRTPSAKFEPEMPQQMSLDFFVNNSELTADFQSLKHVTKKPWCTMLSRRDRLSFADHVRAQISKDRSKSVHQIIADEYQRLLDWEKRRSGIEKTSHLNEAKSPGQNTNSGTSFGSTLKSMFVSTGDISLSTLLKSASKYLEQSITYVDNRNDPYVVHILEKCEMVTSDPILLSLSIKLDSLEKVVRRIHENLKNCS